MTSRPQMTLLAVLAAAVASTAVGPAAGLVREARAQDGEEDRSADVDDDETVDEDRITEGEDDDSEQRKLSDRIKSVQRKAFLRRHRVEIYPHFGVDLNDAFYTHLVVGGSVGFHVVDSLAIEGRFGYVLDSIEEEPVRFVRETAGALPERPPRFELHGELDLIWAPLYGKISLFGEGILHFDTYLAVGGGVFQTNEGLSPALNIGLGARGFLTDWLVLRVELRDYVFPDTRDGESDLQNLLMINLMVSVFFPTSFEYENQ